MDLESLRIPSSVLQTTAQVMEHARDVRIEPGALELVAQQITERLAAGIDDIETAFGTTGSLEDDVNLVFLETVVNSCFWADTPEQKWVVEKNGERFGGWYGLAACFDMAAARGIPVFDAGFMANLTAEAGRDLFAGAAGSPEIPLLEQRVRNLNEAGRYLLAQHDGQAMNLLATCDFSAPRIAETVTRDLTSFQDGAMYDGEWVWLLKRAQILPSDLSQLSAKYPDFSIKHTDQLTAFADYRLPQVLRHYKAFTYSPDLSRQVDAGEHLPAGSPVEVEIRAATIIACESLKRYLPGRTSADIDIGLWLLSQDLRSDPTLKPHHRTPGIYY